MRCAEQLFEEAAAPASLAECQAEVIRLRKENIMLRRHLEQASRRLSDASWREENERQERQRREDADPPWR